MIRSLRPTGRTPRFVLRLGDFYASGTQDIEEKKIPKYRQVDTCTCEASFSTTTKTIMDSWRKTGQSSDLNNYTDHK